MAWVNNKPARNSGNRHLIGGERQASEKDLNKRLSNLLVIAENGSSGILADLENEVKNLEVKLEKLNKQQSALQLMWEMYLQKNDSQNAENVKQEQRNCKNEIQSLEILKEQALSLLSRYGVLVGTDLPAHKEITLLWDWNATHDSQISVQKGRNIKLLDNSDSEWWLGEFGGKKGYFPASYAYPVIYEVRVLHDHTASSDVELSVTSGAILDAIAVDDEWCSVEDPLTKKDGYIPRAYVEILSQLDVDNLSNSEYNLRGSGNSLKNSGEGSRSQESIQPLTPSSSQDVTNPLTPSASQEQEPSQNKEQASPTSAQQTQHHNESTTTQATQPETQAPHTPVAQDPPKQEPKPEEPQKQHHVQYQTSTEPSKEQAKPQSQPEEEQAKPQSQEQTAPQIHSQSQSSEEKAEPQAQQPEEQTTSQVQQQATQTTQPPPQSSEPQQPKEEPKPEPTKEEIKSSNESKPEEPKREPEQQQQTPTQSATPDATQSESKPQEAVNHSQQATSATQQSEPAEDKSGQKSEYKSKSFFIEKSSSGSYFEGKPVPPPRATNLINAQYRESVTSKFSMSTHRINTLLEETTDVSLDFVQQSSQELKQQAQEEIDRILNEAKDQIKQTPSHS